MKPNVLSSRVICRQPGRYIGWPTVTRTPAGDLLAAFSGDRDAHVCPFGKTQMMRSRDAGATWSEPEIVNDTPLDDRDAGIVALSDGTLVVRWFTLYVHPDGPCAGWIDEQMRESWRPHVATITEDDIARWAPSTARSSAKGRRGYWIRRSTDDGATWEPPKLVAGTSPKPPIELGDGRLLMIGNDGAARESRASRIVVEESQDRGRTWAVVGNLAMFPDDAGFLCEPDIVEVAPGHILAMARHEPFEWDAGAPCSHLYQADSHDGGRTWTDWRRTDIWGLPPHLLKLTDGRLLATYGHRRAPFGQRACLSADGGATWDIENEIVLRDDAESHDLGYPASVQLPDGTVCTVYYQIDPPDEKTSLMATHWQLPE